LEKQKKTSKQYGDALELRVQRMYKRMGKWNVKRDVHLYDKFGNESQIDVVYGLFFKTYVECKNYSSKPVPLSDVAKFKEVLALNNIPPRALTIGIKTVNGDQLVRLEKKSRSKGIFRQLLLLILLGFIGNQLYLLRDEWSQMHEIEYWGRKLKMWKSTIEDRLQDLLQV